jgi:hypothetical protein
MAHHDILRRRAILVAFGVEADINGWARLGGSVVIDPLQTIGFRLAATRRPRPRRSSISPMSKNQAVKETPEQIVAQLDGGAAQANECANEEDGAPRAAYCCDLLSSSRSRTSSDTKRSARCHASSLSPRNVKNFLNTARWAVVSMAAIQTCCTSVLVF